MGLSDRQPLAGCRISQCRSERRRPQTTDIPWHGSATEKNDPKPSFAGMHIVRVLHAQMEAVQHL